MKKLIIFLMAFWAANSVAQDIRPFSIHGEIRGATSGKIYLSYQENENQVVTDSTELQGGKFLFKGSITGPTRSSIRYQLDSGAEGWWQLYIEPAAIQLHADTSKLEQPHVEGSAVQAEYNTLQSRFEPIRARSNQLQKAYETKNLAYIETKRKLDSLKEELEVIRGQLEPFSKEFEKVNLAFFDEYPQSLVTADQLRFYVGRLSIDSLQQYYDRLGKQTQETPAGKELKAEIQKMINGSPGSTAHVFTATDINGQPLSLADFKGKYVLIDFWASWCVPCRKGNPHLKALYAKYKNKGAGFEIIGISDDDSKPEAWKEAVETDGIGIWKHVLRGLKQTPEGGFDRSEDISEHFGIHTLPTKILVDPKGVIIGRYGSEEAELDKQLAEIFGD